ncbi:MAG: transcriptional regulator [Desulfococcaceae bacterium]
MSQKELADRTGLTVQSIHRIMNGDEPITLETASRLQLATGCIRKPVEQSGTSVSATDGQLVILSLPILT